MLSYKKQHKILLSKIHFFLTEHHQKLVITSHIDIETIKYVRMTRHKVRTLVLTL